MTVAEAQHRVDEISFELKELWRQIQEKEAERAQFDRIANPEDYESQ